MKTAKKVLCLMLCVALMAGTFCTAASAVEWSGAKITDPGFAAKQDGEFLYVAVGDSASMGYMMDDMIEDFQHVTDVVRGGGASTPSSMSVYSTLSKYLAEVAGIENLVTKDLSMTGMRPLELRSILDRDYYDFHQSEVMEGSTETTFWGYHMWEYLNSGGRHGYQTYDAINKAYTEFLYNADLITIDLTMNDFGTYLGSRVKDAANPCYANETLANVLAEGNYHEVAEAVESLKAVLEEILAKVELPLDAATIEGYLDMFLYCFANFAINFSKTMDLIYTNNPDAQIIIVGPFNVMEGVTFKFGDVEIDAELVWNALNEAVTAYVCAVDSHKSQYKFADMSGGCETCITAIANGDWDKYDVMTYQYVASFLGGYLGKIFGLFDEGLISMAFPEEAKKGTFDGMTADAASDDYHVAGKMLNFATKNSAAIVDAVETYVDPGAAAALEYLFGMIELFKTNMTKIANEPTIPFMEVMAGLSAAEDDPDNMENMVTRALTDFDHASEADIGAAHTALRLVTVYSLGCHPDAKGYDQKSAAVIKAYEKDYAADGTYMARVVEKTVDSSIGFIGHLFNVIMGRESLADLKAYVLSIFQPMLKVFDLAGSFGLC